MAAEFFLIFDDNLFTENDFVNTLSELNTFKTNNGEKIILKSKIFENEEDTWDDVHFHFKNRPIEMIVFGHPPSIEKDILKLIKLIRKNTQLQIIDEDGELSNWAKTSTI